MITISQWSLEAGRLGPTASHRLVQAATKERELLSEIIRKLGLNQKRIIEDADSCLLHFDRSTCSVSDTLAEAFESARESWRSTPHIQGLNRAQLCKALNPKNRKHALRLHVWAVVMIVIADRAASVRPELIVEASRIWHSLLPMAADLNELAETTYEHDESPGGLDGHTICLD
jgi:hypothetical protein